MPRYLLWWNKLIKTGTLPFMPFQEHRRIVVTNIAGISAGCYFKRQTVAYQNRIEQQNKEPENLNANNGKIMSVVARDIQ